MPLDPKDQEQQFGIVVLEDRFSDVDTALDVDSTFPSVFTQQGPMPGSSENVDPRSNARIRVTQAQDKDYNFTVERAGSPGSSLQNVPRLQVRKGTGALADEDELFRRGWNFYNYLMSTYQVDYSDIRSYAPPDVTVDRLRGVVIVGAKRIDAAHVATKSEQIFAVDGETEAIGAGVDISVGFSDVLGVRQETRFAVWVDQAAGYVYALSAVGTNVTSGTLANGRLKRASLDNLGLWTLVGENVLDVNIPSSISYCRAAFDATRNSVVWFARLTGLGQVLQYGSVNSGANFTQVMNTTDIIHIDACFLSSGAVLFAYVDSAQRARVTRGASVLSPVDELAAISNVDLGDDVENISIFCDDADTVIVISEKSVGQEIGSQLVWVSTDFGASFNSVPWSIYNPNGGSVAEGPQSMVAATACGKAFYVHQFGTVGTFSNSIIVSVAGGWVDWTATDDTTSMIDGIQSRIGTGEKSPSNGEDGITWLPQVEPSVLVAWTKTGVGTALLVDGSYFMKHADGLVASYLAVLSGAGADPDLSFNCGCLVRVNSGGSTILQLAGIQIRGDTAGGGLQFGIDVYFSSTSIRVVDALAGAFDVTVVPTNDFTGFTHCHFTMDRDLIFHCYVRREGSTISERITDSLCGTIPTSGTLNRSVEFNQFAAGAVDVDWKLFYHGIEFQGDGMQSSRAQDVGAVVAKNNPYGYPSFRKPYPLFEKTDDGFQQLIQSEGGPFFANEEIIVSPSYQYGIDNLFWRQSQSYEEVWRSVDDTSDVELRIVELEVHLLAYTIALVLHGCNFRTVVLQAGSNTLAPLDVITFDLATDFTGLTYSISGLGGSNNVGILQPSAGTIAGGRYVWANEFRDGYVELAAGIVRKIKHNTSGVWRDPTGPVVSRQVTFFIELQGGEPTAGTCHIWPNRAICLFNPITNYTAANRIGFKIPAQSTTEGYFQLGGFTLGGVNIMGRDFDNGWSRRKVSNVRDATSDFGVVTAKRLSRRREERTYTWSRMLSTHSLQQVNSTNVATDFTTRVTTPIVVPGVDLNDVESQLYWLSDLLLDGELPLVAIHNVPADIAPGTGLVLTDARQFLCGTMLESRLRAGNVRGQIAAGVDRGESHTFGQLVIREII